MGLAKLTRRLDGCHEPTDKGLNRLTVERKPAFRDVTKVFF
jgi:hypothetical protein